jgi:hemerythrin superfamily protein
MNAIQMLLDDHQKVRDLYAEWKSGGKDQHQQIGNQILQELFMHSKLEEEIFYPAFRNAADAQGKELTAEAYEEHAKVDEMVTRLMGMTAADNEYSSMFRELMQNVEHHVQEEETEMLPVARDVMSNQLDQLGQDMMMRKQQLMSTMQAGMSR